MIIKAKKTNKYYLVEQINNNKLYLFGIIKTFDIIDFVTEDGCEINTINYINIMCCTKKNTHDNDMVMCVKLYGNNLLVLGDILQISEVEYYPNNKMKFKFNNLLHRYRSERFQSNMFIIYNKKNLRILKYYKIFYGIEIY